MIPDIKPIASLVGGQREYATAAAYVTGLDMLPLGRVVNNEKVTDHHAIIPTLAERHPVDKMDDDDRRIYDLVVRRFLAVFHPEAVFENTRVETTVAETPMSSAPAACKLLLVPGWRGVYGEAVAADASAPGADEDDEGQDQQLPKLQQGEQAKVHRVALRRQGDQAAAALPRTARCSTRWRLPAKRVVDDEELREAMKDSGIGTPATRAAIIERLLQVGYVERDGRALVVTEKEHERDPGCSATTR